MLFCNTSITIALIVGVFFLVAIIIIAGTEKAILSLLPSSKVRFEKDNNKKAKKLVRLISSPEKLVATLLIANTFFKTGFLVIAAFFIYSLAPIITLWQVLFIILAGTLAITIIFEWIPKVIAGAMPEQYLLAVTPGIAIIQKIFSPISYIFYKATLSFNQRLAQKSQEISASDLTNAIELASDSLPEEEDILKGIVKFGNIDVSEILRPRVDVVAIDTKLNLRQVLSIVVESEYSRIPVYSGSFDNVKGILYVKDLLPHIDEKENFRWQSLLRQAYFIPETKKVKDLLTEFQASKNHMAIVVDEYGGSLGIVTLEDILEEIVGEIADETDEEEKFYTKISENTYIFDGKTLLNDFHKILQTDPTVFDDVKGEADTLAGLILEIKGAIPSRNEQVNYEQFTFKIEAADSRRIKQIRVTLT